MTNLLLLKETFLTVSSEDISFLNSIVSTLQFNDYSKAYVYGKFNKENIKKVSLAKKIENAEVPTIKIPIGYENFIRSIIKEKDFNIVDQRKKIEKLNPQDDDIKNIFIKSGITLREHQIYLLKKIFNNRRGIIESPTASGKSEIFLALLSLLQTDSLVVFNRSLLTQQIVKRAATRGLDAGIVQGKNILEKKITMCTIQSQHKIENIKKYKNLIIDEVHNATSKEYLKLLKSNKWERVYGFSATAVNPHKVDLNTAILIGNVGPVIGKIESEELIEKGVIAKPIVKIIGIDKPDNIYDFNYQQAEATAIISNTYRNEIIAKIAEKNIDSGVLIMTKYIRQGEEIQKLIPTAPFISGTESVLKRNEELQKFESGKTKILIASRILDEGIDIINFKTLIIGSAGKSYKKVIQRIGRGLRVNKEKDKIYVYDFMDKTHHSLENHSKERIKHYKKWGYTDIEYIEGESFDL